MVVAEASLQLYGMALRDIQAVSKSSVMMTPLAVVWLLHEGQLLAEPSSRLLRAAEAGQSATARAAATRRR